MRGRSLNAQGRASSEPRSALAKSEGRMPGDRAAGGVFLWLPFFAQAKKVTRAASCAEASAPQVIVANAAQSPAARSVRRRCR
jgi:hypothetical protein